MVTYAFLIIGIVLVIIAIAIGESSFHLYKNKKEKHAMYKGYILGIASTIIALIGVFYIIIFPMTQFTTTQETIDNMKQINLIKFDTVDSICIDSIKMWQID
jgi:uncharacterized membrane protein